jgi:hypothetical protein
MMKALLPLFNPLVLIWLLLGIWLVRRGLRRQWKELWMPGLAWLILSLVSCTGLPSWLIGRLESATPITRMEDLPTADAIVCLGGGVEPSLVEPTGLHLKTAADRLSTALATFRAGKAPVMVLGGGLLAQPKKPSSLLCGTSSTVLLQTFSRSPRRIVSN